MRSRRTLPSAAPRLAVFRPIDGWTFSARWPVPAVSVWAAAWVAYAAFRALDTPVMAAFGVAAMVGFAACPLGRTTSRRALIAVGFPLSYFSTGAAIELPSWIWLAPLALLATVYPMRRWGDAPLFPTPACAVRGLSALAALPPGSRIVDAGSGLGAALRALRHEYPLARLDGIEWSWLLCRASALRCGGANIERGDIWAADWSVYDMVYLFQRPETIERALLKAARELRPGAWLASLEFAPPGHPPTARHQCDDGRSVWLWRAPFVLPPGPASYRDVSNSPTSSGVSDDA